MGCTKIRVKGHRCLRPLQADHQELQALRKEQQTAAWERRYERRAGIEGTLSQAVRAFELRQTWYIGLAKMLLQHVLIALGVNLVRLVAWLTGVRRETSRVSCFAALVTPAL